MVGFQALFLTWVPRRLGLPRACRALMATIRPKQSRVVVLCQVVHSVAAALSHFGQPDVAAYPELGKLVGRAAKVLGIHFVPCICVVTLGLRGIVWHGTLW